MLHVVPALSRRTIAVLISFALSIGVLVAAQGALDPPTAHADTVPAANGTPATVSAGALPTAQVNGIVWAQVTVGNTVFATGSFIRARPAGSAIGQNETVVGNLVAYDITTGVMISKYNRILNGEGQSIAKSPDGKTVYIGGQFTTVDGIAHPHIVAINVATGAIDATFQGKVGSNLQALAVAPNGTIYAGGSFVSAGTIGSHDIARTNLAAFTPTGRLLDNWAPHANGGFVLAMVISPVGNKVIVGGNFGTLTNVFNGVSTGQLAYGQGAIDLDTGAIQPWLASTDIHAYGSLCAVDTLSTDGKQIYGGNYENSVLCGNLEGRYALNPADGAINWVNDCHGDSYATLPIGDVLYSTSHTHDCRWIGSFGDINAAGEIWKRTMAETTYPTTTNVGPDSYGWNWNGTPAPSVLDWFPRLTAAPKVPSNGIYAVSGAVEAGWSLTTNAAQTYISVGGEMTAADGKPQQALVRYAVRSISHTSGPVYGNLGSPTVSAGLPGTATVSWNVTWDRDSQNLTYQVYRDGGTTPLTTQVIPSTFWQMTGTGNVIDTGLAAGAHKYTLKVTDPDGNSITKSTIVTITTGGTAPAKSGDLALGKPTSTSGLNVGGQESWRAVDGNIDGNGTAYSMAIAAYAPGSWWQVDLQSSQAIRTVNVYGRTDCCGDQDADYWVFVSNSPLDPRLTPAQQSKVAGVWSSYQSAQAYGGTSIQLPSGSTGRYVMVRHGGTNYLSLAEVTVTAPSPQPIDLALQKPTSESNPYSASAGAVDGNTNGNWVLGAFAIANAGVNPWWQVDLGASQPVSTINIFGRTDAGLAGWVQSADLWVFTSNTPFNTALTPAQQAKSAGVWSSYRALAASPSTGITLPAGQTARYVMIQHGGNEVLSLGEVQVLGQPVNLAVGAKATQSSTLTSYQAIGAVDGNVQSTAASNSMAITNPDANAWWQVDLGASTKVSAVNVIGRSDGGFDQSADYWVFTSNSPFVDGLTAAQQATRLGVWSSYQAAGAGPLASIPLPAGATARYVMIQHTRANYLSLGEVQVVGPTALPVDLAQGKPATQSSTLAGTYVASRAVDGSLLTANGEGVPTFAITNPDTHAWWQVDLGAAKSIRSIFVYGRTDGGLSQSGDYWIFVSKTPFNTALTAAQQADVAGVWSTYQAAASSPSTAFTLPAGSIGRYVMIQHGGTDYLSLAEVQVMS